MELQFLGAAREVGRSAIFLKHKKNLLFDYGLKIFGDDTFPYPFSDRVDALILSHAHLDHSGYIPKLYQHSKIPFYSTPPTLEIAKILFKDSIKLSHGTYYKKQDARKAVNNWNPVVYNEHLSIADYDISFYDAGHIIGSMLTEINIKDKTILYTGDFKIEETRLHKGANYSKDVDILITESTYAFREHPKRKELENAFYKEIEETIDKGETVLLPAFAVGRSQELIAILADRFKDIPIYLDGMGKSVSSVYLKYPEYVKKPMAFINAFNNVKKVKARKDRERIAKGQSIIITTAGLLEGGPVLDYLNLISENSTIILTGFPVPGTNAWLLINKGMIYVDDKEFKVKQKVIYNDFSAHAGRSDLLEMIKRTNPERIFVIHGDQTKEFADELREKGYDAEAPNLGASYIL